MIENNIIGICKPGFQKKRYQKLKKGELNIAFEIDLHGKNLIEAENFLDIWLPKLQMEDNLVGIIIHGKGYGSINKEPVLKKKVRNWLCQKDEVIAFAEAPKHDGGSGVVLVLLKEYN